MEGLVGRAVECERLDRLLGEARQGLSGTLVLRGEPGVGKTSLLNYLAASAPDFQVARVGGVESEMELSFAALHQLLRPSLDAADELPPPQRAALRLAFGLEDGAPPGSRRWGCSPGAPRPGPCSAWSTTRTGWIMSRPPRSRSWPAGCTPTPS